MRDALYRGMLLHMLNADVAEFIADGALLVQNGRITWYGSFDDAKAYADGDTPIIDWRNSLIIPGLVDTHAHLPQLPALGADRPDLLTWLREVIYPLEAQCVDADYAYMLAHAFFRTALRNGTTTVAVYAPPFAQATDACFHAAVETGIRVLMGMTMMDCNAPSDLLSPPRSLITSVAKLAAQWHGRENRLFYCITPRFAGSCSRELLAACGSLARESGLPIQTHLAESPAEVRSIAELFPDYPDYTSIYEHAGLVGPKTILAHCIYLSTSELERIKRAGSAIAHCPSSNTFLRSGIMPLVMYLQRWQLRVGLGSDIGAGFQICMLDEARTAREHTKVLGLYRDDQEPASVENVFYLATLGGAEALCLAECIGNFAVGKDADIVCIDVPQHRTFDSARQALEYVIYDSTSRNIQAVLRSGVLLWQS